MLSERLQILIDSERLSRLRKLAAERGVSVAQVIREAVDQAITPRSEATEKALSAIMHAEPMPVPDPADLKRELDAIRRGRF